MTRKMGIILILLASIILLAACGQDEAASNNESNTEATVTDEGNGDSGVENEKAEKKEGEKGEAELGETYSMILDKLSNTKENNYDQVIKMYEEKLQSFVQKSDQEIDQQITTAFEAGKAEELDGPVVKEIFDKLMQKSFFFTVRVEFREVAEKWDNKEEVNKEIEEAKEFYEIIRPTVKKQDSSGTTKLVDKIETGFDKIEKAVEDGDQLAFGVAKQIVDKSLMKTYYLVANGQAVEAAKLAGEDSKAARAKQAAAWGAFQSLYGYVSGSAKEESDFIQQQLSLETDVKKLDSEAIQNAFVRGFLKVALHEYEESQEYWGKDKSVVTAKEGALFINIVDSELKQILGEEAFKTLSDQAKNYLDAAKSQNKEKAEQIIQKIEDTLNNVIEKAK